MSLIIAARCKDGAVAIADKRSHINEKGVISFDDNYDKLKVVKGHLVYNHGYNRIYDKDWKESRLTLTPNDKNPVYSQIASEMTSKVDKFAGYVFLSKNTFYEIEVDAGKAPIGTQRREHDRIKRGSGEEFVDLDQLVNLKDKRIKEITPILKKMFCEAYAKQVESGCEYFSSQYTLKAVRN